MGPGAQPEIFLLGAEVKVLGAVVLVVFVLGFYNSRAFIWGL